MNCNFKNIGLLILVVILSSSINSQNIYAYAGGPSGGFFGDGGPALQAKFNLAESIAFDGSGNMYIADVSNRRIRKIDATTWSVNTICGTGASGFSGDGGPALSAEINTARGVVIDAAGNVYITDGANSRIRKINTSGIITTYAGNGGSGNTGDGGLATAAQIGFPWGITVDALGNVFFTDSYNHCVRKINTSGIISTIAGTGTLGFSGDGGIGTSAQLWSPIGIAIDALGNIYISDTNNNRIRKINTSGIITTITGTNTGGFSGDGGPATSAQLYGPRGISCDLAGNIYIADYFNYRIRKINNSGIISTIVGNGMNGSSGDGGLATLASISPTDVKVDAFSNVYICESVTRIKIICQTDCLAGLNELSQKNKLTIYPNPTSNILQIESNQHIEFGEEIEIMNVFGQVVLKAPYNKNINVSGLENGYYFLKIISSDKQQYNSKFIKE